MIDAIGVIGGSGIYQMEGFEKTTEKAIDTPFGSPSDSFIGGTIAGKQIWFLPRHGAHHQLMPHEINHRANLWAMKSLGIKWLVCVTAVGSLKEQYAPRDIVVPDQFFDRTSRRAEHTFFGNGIGAHIGFGEPTSPYLREILVEASKKNGATVHAGGTYVNMDGPAFSTKAESMANRQLGFDVIGMTNLAEAKLARECEIAMATLSMVTDYDCWKEDEEHVSVGAVLDNLRANATMAQQILSTVISEIDFEEKLPEHTSLDGAIITPQEYWPEETKIKLQPLLERFTT